MGRILEMDDVIKGMFLTVLRGSVSNRVVRGPMGPIPETKEDSRLNGKILKVIAVDLPFIVVEFFYGPSIEKTRKESLDVRNIVLGTLTLEYMAAAEPRWKIPIIPTFDDNPDWTYEGWKEQKIKKIGPVKEIDQRPDYYKDNELVNSL